MAAMATARREAIRRELRERRNKTAQNQKNQPVEQLQVSAGVDAPLNAIELQHLFGTAAASGVLPNGEDNGGAGQQAQQQDVDRYDYIERKKSVNVVPTLATPSRQKEQERIEARQAAADEVEKNVRVLQGPALKRYDAAPDANEENKSQVDTAADAHEGLAQKTHDLFLRRDRYTYHDKYIDALSAMQRNHVQQVPPCASGMLDEWCIFGRLELESGPLSYGWLTEAALCAGLCRDEGLTCALFNDATGAASSFSRSGTIRPHTYFLSRRLLQRHPLGTNLFPEDKNEHDESGPDASSSSTSRTLDEAGIAPHLQGSIQHHSNNYDARIAEWMAHVSSSLTYHLLDVDLNMSPVSWCESYMDLLRISRDYGEEARGNSGPVDDYLQHVDHERRTSSVPEEDRNRELAEGCSSSDHAPVRGVGLPDKRPHGADEANGAGGATKRRKFEKNEKARTTLEAGGRGQKDSRRPVRRHYRRLHAFDIGEQQREAEAQEEEPVTGLHSPNSEDASRLLTAEIFICDTKDMQIVFRSDEEVRAAPTDLSFWQLLQRHRVPFECAAAIRYQGSHGQSHYFVSGSSSGYAHSAGDIQNLARGNRMDVNLTITKSSDTTLYVRGAGAVAAFADVFRMRCLNRNRYKKQPLPRLIAQHSFLGGRLHRCTAHVAREERHETTDPSAAKHASNADFARTRLNFDGHDSVDEKQSASGVVTLVNNYLTLKGALFPRQIARFLSHAAAASDNFTATLLAGPTAQVCDAVLQRVAYSNTSRSRSTIGKTHEKEPPFSLLWQEVVKGIE
ncbi:unnamed protein product [Amoebophrya sp. A25]|nr:unnamed protein product [Amoebophrya sp. A25]|eukprot:GSA25T00001052001.1